MPLRPSRVAVGACAALLAWICAFLSGLGGARGAALAFLALILVGVAFRLYDIARIGRRSELPSAHTRVWLELLVRGYRGP